MLELRQISKFVVVHGPAEDSEIVPESSFDYFSDILPDGLLRHWVEFGWSSYANGLLRTVNPEGFDNIFIDWLGENSEDAHAILRTAFGDIIFWRNNKAFYLDVLYNKVFEITDNLKLLFDYSLCNDRYLKIVVKEPLYIKALPKLGKPAYDECYGFFPTLSMGGLCIAENLRKVKLYEHLELLRQVR